MNNDTPFNKDTAFTQQNEDKNLQNQRPDLLDKGLDLTQEAVTKTKEEMADLVQKAKEETANLKENAAKCLEETTVYIKENPAKSLLMAVAGGVLLGLLLKG